MSEQHDSQQKHEIHAGAIAEVVPQEFDCEDGSQGTTEPGGVSFGQDRQTRGSEDDYDGRVQKVLLHYLAPDVDVLVDQHLRLRQQTIYTSIRQLDMSDYFKDSLYLSSCTQRNKKKGIMSV